MSRRTLTLMLAAAPLTFALLLAGARASAGAVTFTPCAAEPGFGCASVAVPLDHSGRIPGTISLSVERKAAGAGQTAAAVLALAGGPGQAALPLAATFAKTIAPALGAHDLIVFDQRGTGTSDPLNCSSFNTVSALESTSTQSAAALVDRCALEIGPARATFTTRESVRDIEALRAALGYEKLVLYGVSYGTKVALEYAETYPQHVEALVLDSVVPVGGPEPFGVPTFQAIPAMLGELCSAGACRGITADPLADLARLVARLRKRALGGSVFDGSGHRHAATLDELGLLNILEAGDLNPALRALLPAAVRSALRDDPDPLLRLNRLAEGLIPSVGNGPVGEAEAAEHEEDDALFTATTCEETPFPWQRGASAGTRLHEALATLHTIPPADFYPFDATTALEDSDMLTCAGWPDASAPPQAPGPLPDVPTLIFSGAQDLRTPTVSARALAGEIPGAELEVVPYTGHAVLSSDFSGCAQRAVSSFFAAEPVRPCGAVSNLFKPTPITPTKLAYVSAPPGLGGKPGRTLTAVLDTLVDLNEQLIGATLEAEQALPSGASFGGLRGGFARLGSSAVDLRDLSFVPGVSLDGRLHLVRDDRVGLATVHVLGADAAHGTVVIGAGKRVTGTLGGRRFDVSISSVKLARAGGGEWPEAGLGLLAPAERRGEH